jgi:zinc transport system ATP-binding protein
MPVDVSAVEFDHASFAYRSGQTVLRDIDFSIANGEFVAIAGPNGGGKTTLLRLLLGLERPQDGHVLLFGEPAHASEQRRRVGYLAQRSRLGADAPATVREVVSSGRIAVRGPFGPLHAADREVVDEAIARVGLAGSSTTPLRVLSGGQQQRAFIAKALAAEPSLLVLDEPTTGVDVSAQEALAALLARLHADMGTTIVYVSHEFGAVEQYVERLLLVSGRIAFDGPPSQLPGMWHDPSHTHA